MRTQGVNYKDLPSGKLTCLLVDKFPQGSLHVGMHACRARMIAQRQRIGDECRLRVTESTSVALRKWRNLFFLIFMFCSCFVGGLWDGGSAALFATQQSVCLL